MIGAGPGDPGLLTIKGKQCLEQSDVVVYDYLVGKEILNNLKKDVRLIYVGKKSGSHTVSQRKLNEILLEEALKGNTVARLKGGDPFMFGRGGEEVQVLAAAGVPFEIVPGITSAIAAPAYAGIPLTHRDFASTVAMITGHEDPKKEESQIKWESIASLDTLVFLMGVANLRGIASNLVEHGRDPATPVALIRWGTTPDQKTLLATLGTIAELAEKQDCKPPSIFVVGDVVALRQSLQWFETKPLFGKSIIVTRAEHQIEEITRLLHHEGARVLAFPVIEIKPPRTYSDVDQAIKYIEQYQWIIFTSVNGVKAFFDRFKMLRKDIRDLKGIHICAIGPATRRTIEEFGICVEMTPDTYISEEIVDSFASFDIKGARVLLPRAERARDIIPKGLSSLGARVDCVAVYRTVQSDREKAGFQKMLKENVIDVITFTSPSTVNSLMQIIGGKDELPEEIKIACIGPVTAQAAEAAGLHVDIMEGEYTVSGLIRALVSYFNKGVS